MVNPGDLSQNPPAPVSEQDAEQLRCQAQEYLDGWKRAKADYLNLKRESEKAQKETVQFANAALIINLLPIYANLKRAIAHVPAEQKDQEWVKGIVHIYAQFQGFLSGLGVEEIKTVGEHFDPQLHEAVSQQKQEGAVPGTIISEVNPGFMFQGRALEPAKVIVSE